jgi:AcrR family transcriptional regulator
MSSLLDAARDLFALRGPDSVSVRDVADRAHVNHALIYRHFGTKEGLLKAVLEREALAFSAAIGNSEDPIESVNSLFKENERREPFMRIMAFSLLSGSPVADLYSEKGALGHLLAQVRAASTETPQTRGATVDPRVSVAAVSAFMKGWLLFEPWVLQAVQAEQEDVAVIRSEVMRLLDQVIRSALTDEALPRPSL